MADFSSFGLNNNGFKFPVFSDFMSLMQEQGKIEYGEDFTIDPETSLGQFMEVFCYMYEGVSNLYQNIYDSIFLFSMQGQMLDRFAMNFNITRLQGRKAYGNMEFTGTKNYIVSKGFEVKGQNGLFYTLVSNVLLDSSGVGIGQIVANETGADYNTSVNTITEKATGDENVTSITNITAVENGSDIESDFDFRERIMKLFQGNESASVNGIKKAMLELTQVRDCLVIENNTNNDDPETGLKPGEIEVIIKGLIDEEVAYKLFNTRSAGIRTVGNKEFPLISDSNQMITERLYQAEEKLLYIKVQNIQLYSGMSLDEKVVITEQLMTRISGKLGLGTKANYEKVLAAVYDIDEVEEADVSISIDNTNFFKTDIVILRTEYLTLNSENITIILSSDSDGG